MYSDIVKSVKTSDELAGLSSQVSDLREAMFSTTSTNFDEILKKMAPVSLAEKIKKSVGAVGAQEFIDGLQKALSEVKVIKLTLSFEPTEELMEMMRSFIESNTNMHKVLDIEVDPKIIGGLIIEDGGLYKDYTLRKHLLEYFYRHSGRSKATDRI